MDDALRKLRREPPVYLYRGVQVLIVQNMKRHYEVHLNGERLRAASDVLPLEFLTYDFARLAAEKAVNGKLLRDAQRAVCATKPRGLLS